MQSDPPITLVLNQCAEADQPLHMEWDAGWKWKMNNEQEKTAKTKTWCQKEKQRELSGIISATRRMILTEHVFCVDSALDLLPQREVTQLICLTIYVGTTQQSPARVLFWKPAHSRHAYNCIRPVSDSSRNYIPHDPLWIVTDARPAPEGKLDGHNF